MQLDLNDVYCIGEGFKRTAVRVDLRHDDAFPDDVAVTRAEVVPADPIQLIVDEGKKQFDLIGATLAIPKIVSGRFIEILNDNNFTGWSTYPVEILQKDGSRIEGYVGLAVLGRCGPIDDSLSERVVLEPLAPGGTAVDGLKGWLFQIETWDGSDLFMPAGSGAIFVTKPVRDALVAGGVTNVKLDPIAEIESMLLPKS